MRITSFALFLVSMVSADAGLMIHAPAPKAHEGHISGRVLGLEGNDHVIVKAVGRKTYRTTTRSEGRWSISAMAAGTYTLTPISARYLFEPAHLAIDSGNEPVEDLDFKATPIRELQSPTAAPEPVR